MLDFIVKMTLIQNSKLAKALANLIGINLYGKYLYLL